MSTGFGWTLPAPSEPVPGRVVPTDEGTRDLLGYDIHHRAGVLQLTPGGDYGRVGGMDNLRAAIYRRLLVKPGEYRFRPDYGVGVATFVKRAASKANLDALRQRIVDQLSQDRRLQHVEVAVDSIAVHGQSVIRVYVKCTSGGTERKFEPFTFAEAAA